MTNHDVYNAVQQLGGDISDEELIVEYEMTDGGQKVIGGDVVSASEHYDNRTNTRTVRIDLTSHAGDWRLEAVNGEYAVEVTLYKLTWEMDDFEKVKVDTKTRVSDHDGVTDVMTAEEW